MRTIQISESLIRNPPFFDPPQKRFIEWLMAEVLKNKKENEVLKIRLAIMSRTVESLDLFHNRETKPFLRSPMGDLRNGVMYHSSEIGLTRLDRYTLNELKEIISSQTDQVKTE